MVEVTSGDHNVSISQSSTKYTIELTAMEDDIFFTVDAHTYLAGGSASVSTTADVTSDGYEISEGNTERVTVTVGRSSNFLEGEEFDTKITISAEDSDGDEVKVDEFIFSSLAE